jgi:hypothetical protein
MKNVGVSELREDRATLMILREGADGQRTGYPVTCVRTPDGWKIVDY